MNRVFRIIWSRALGAWVVASELATRCGKGRGVDASVDCSGPSMEGVNDAGSRGRWRLRVSIALALLNVHLPTWAADRWWDPNNTGIGLGGTGTWNTIGSFWSPNNDGVSGPYSAWNNAALDDAFFGGTAGTVTLGTPITVHNLTFLSNGYTLSGSTLTLAGTTPSINTGNGAVTQTINSVIAGNAGLTKTGTGTLALNGANTFSGAININAGGLSVNGNSALGAAGNTINLAAGASLTAGTTGGDLANRTVILGGPGQSTIAGAGVGSAFFTGAGGLTFNGGGGISNDANNYTGATSFVGGGTKFFTSIGNLGEASSLGAPTTAANGTITLSGVSQVASSLSYVGDGDSSNRNWNINPGAGPGNTITFRNSGTGTLALTGNIALGGGSGNGAQFHAQTADLGLLGVISSNNGRPVTFVADAGRTVTLGDTNTFSGGASISGAGKAVAGTIADSGVASSLGTGTGTTISGNGTLSYAGAVASSNRNWTLSNGTLSNDGTGALTLSGSMAITNTATLGGSFTGNNNVITGVISGAGNLRSGGDGIWILTGANTYTGQTIVDSGVLRAGTAGAFGASDTFVVNFGTLGLSSFDQTIARLTGTGGTVDLGSATLTVEMDEGVSATYAGSISGIGGLTKLGAGTQTLTGASTYTGDTTIGGGALNLDFSGAGGPTGNILSSASTLNMNGGTLNVIGAAGEASTQTFDGVNITAGNNTIGASSGSGGSMTVNLGTITRTGGLLNFNLPGSGNITTTNADMFLAWATVNGTDYAKVEGGNILAFVEDDYSDKDNAANWLSGEVITDVDGFFGTVNGSVQLGGLRYTQPVSTTVTVQGGEILGVDAPIIVAPSVLGTNQQITDGMITGGSGIGDALTIQQNGSGNFTIASQVVDNGNNLGFTKAGTGLVTLGNANNSYTGATQVLEGTLSVSNIGNGAVASGIGASSADSSNLVLEGSTLRYTGGTASSDRGFTTVKSGDILGATVEVTNAGANLTFSGLVTSPDGAGLTKSGAGTLTLANDTNDYTGVTTVAGGLLSVVTLANGGQVSGIGASSAASSNLVLDGGGLQYTGATTSTNRGFTLGGNTSIGTVDVSNAATTLTISGTVVEAAGGNRRLIKNGAGTLVLSGTNTYTGGNTVNAGTLRAGSTQAFGTPGNSFATMELANAAGVALDLNNFNNTIGPLNGGGANGGNVTLGSATLRIVSGDGNYSGVISGTGGILRTDGGTQTFNGCNNTYTGATILQGANLRVDCLADGGLASGIGASNAASTNLVFNNGSLEYTGGSVSIDRGFQLTAAGGINVINAGTTLEFGGAVTGGGTLIKRNAGTLVLSGTNTYTGHTQVEGGVLRAGATNAFGPSGNMTLNNAAGVLLDLSGFNAAVTSLIGGGTNGGNIDLGSATLTILDGGNQSYSGAVTGTGNLVKNGGGNQRLAGCNSTYSGTTTVNAGFLSVDCLANGGVNSSIGASTSDPANLVLNGGTLNYVGTGGSTDRQFTLGGSASIASAGSGAIAFDFTGPVTLTGTTARTLTLTGTDTGTNIFAAQLDNSGAGVTSLTKTGTGLWRLTSANSTYTGVTRINGGILEVDEFADGGVASSIGASSGAAANLVIGNGSTLRYTGTGDSSNRQFTLDTGVTFLESSGTGALQFTNTGAVALTGTNTARTMAVGGTNTGDNIFGGAIGDNGTGATTLAKNDSGTWILTGNNSFTGNTVINDGNLVIGNGGTTGNAGAGDVIVDSPTSTLSLNRSDTFTFDGTLSGPGTLAQVGSGTSVLTSAGNSIGATTLSAGTLQVDGGLETSTVGMTGTSALTVNGTVQADGPAPTALAGDIGNQTVTVNTGGTLLASGDLGDGNDTIDLTGTLDTGTGTLSLGDGDDTLVLNDGAQMLGSGVNASGGGTDTLVVNTVLGYTLDGGAIDTFDILTKQNTGTLTLTGEHLYSAGTHLDGGTLDVDGTLDTSTVALADDTILNVDGSIASGDGIATLTGSAGTNTVNVNSGGALHADGDLGGGADAVTLAGLLNTDTGTLALGDGDDTFILQDGAEIAGTGVDAGIGSNDQLVLDNALALTFDGGQAAGFETLLKQNTGTASMTGSQSFIGGTTIDGGTLDVDGTLQTPTIDLADSAALNVDGTVAGGAGTAAVITGSAGDNTVAIGQGGTLLANGNLGTGNDVLDVAGTLDTAGGVLALGDGDDTLTIHESTNIVGTVSAGAGNDTFDTHIDTVADLGAVQGFETLSKTGSGELNINGPLSSDFLAVEVLEGVLDVTGAGEVIPAPGNTLTTTVTSGATLNVDGSYGCGADDDTMTVAGTVSGSGTIDLCDGADVLALQDGVVLSNVISGGLGTGDTIVLDSAAALTFDAGNTSGFELLRKDNAGTATLTGTQAFTGGTTITGGTLDVDGTLATPTVALASGTTLNVDGLLDAGGTATSIAGDAGANTVSIGAGGTLLAAGDLGDGNDVLDVAGTLDTDGGVLALGDGDDTLTIHESTNIVGTVSAGAGTNTFNTHIDTVADLGAVQGFQILRKTGSGELNINGPMSSDFIAVEVREGVLDVTAAGVVVPAPGNTLTTTVTSGATLNVDGSYGCGAANDTMTVAGTVAGSGTIDLCDGDDTLTLQDGVVLANAISGGQGSGDTLVLDSASALTLDAGNTADFERLRKDNTGTGTLTSSQSFIGGTAITGGTLDVDGALQTPSVTLADGATLNVDGAVDGGAGTAASISGSAGDNTVAVGVGGMLLANGDLGAGSDVLDVAGTLDTDGGVFALGDGDDAFTIHDGTVVLGTVDGGAGLDTFNPDIDTSADLGALNNFEILTKTGIGVLNINGPGQSDFVEVNVLEGMLDVTAGGSVVARNTTVAAGATLAVDGSFSGTADADLLDVAGTLDLGGGAFTLGDGDDNFVVHDGTVVLGTVDGGAGLDTRTYDINLIADIGALGNFEGVTKTGTGTLNINGPSATDLQEVQVLGGTLDIGPAGSVVAIAGGPLNTVVGAGATLNVEGRYGCGAGADMMTVSGTVSGSGTIDLCTGDDTLILNDGAVLATVIDGNDPTASDTVILNNANALSFDAANTINFEHLQKDNTGEATLVGAQSFTGGTTLNGGTLSVAGRLETPTVAVADVTVLKIDGTLDAGGSTAAVITGSAGTNTVRVGEGGTLLATGDLGDGNDVLDVSGTLDTAGGTFVLGAGDDTLTIHDDTAIIGTVVAGTGNDTFNADIGTVADLGAVQDFETLSKTGAGELNVNGPMSSDFTTVNVLGGTLDVTAGGSVAAQNTTVASGATLDVLGRYIGTAGDDRFTSMGTVRGAFAFGDGNDQVDFIGGDPSGVTALDGGSGTDRLGFSGLTLSDETVPTLTAWERVELLDGSSLTLASPLDLAGGLLAIDPTSQVFANAGAAITGSVENAGLIDAGANRLAIGGDYIGRNGLLQVTVSPGTLSAGGLDIDGDVTGTTRVAFAGDGSDFTGGGEVSILVVSSPNDSAATAGGFTAADEVIRLHGSILPWSFGQQADHNWYLSAEAGVLPEVPAYGVLQSFGLLAVQNSDNLIHQRLAGVRGRELPLCGTTPEWPVERAGTGVIDDCRGFWVAATGSELELGADPGFEVSGDDVGLYVGVDSAFDRGNRTLRGGLYLAYRHGNYWTTGANSTGLPGSGPAKVGTDTVIGGMYMSHTWDTGRYVNLVLTGQVTDADVSTPDGFLESLAGNALTFSTRVGREYRLDDGWSLEPQLQLAATAVSWGDLIDESGKQVTFDDELVGTARAALRVEKEILRDDGAVIRPWATLSVQKSTGASDTSVSLMTPGVVTSTQAFPNHDLGASATLDVGVEATVSERVSLFGVLSVGTELDGSDYEQREANLGVRVRW
ncbi:autotransporter-associated beta strand repeat-containing protein [Lysobacter changpingensis]|uniref:autotransporter-associated beta strand repeat-containing protein n=1 Tax=Lysobacter changpingensis TaxID=2792784 RepID=UPI001A8EFEDC|nr:autotransporter-associated beta strand repeat-containing protein [Lysobacter changpingensis]